MLRISFRPWLAGPCCSRPAVPSPLRPTASTWHRTAAFPESLPPAAERTERFSRSAAWCTRSNLPAQRTRPSVSARRADPAPPDLFQGRAETRGAEIAGFAVSPASSSSPCHMRVPPDSASVERIAPRVQARTHSRRHHLRSFVVRLNRKLALSLRRVRSPRSPLLFCGSIISPASLKSLIDGTYRNS